MIKIMKMSEIALEEILERTIPMSTVEDQVQEIVAEVRAKGDAALYMYSEKFDKAKLTALEVSKEEIEQAYESVDEKFREILKEAAANIRAFHQNQVKSGFIYNERRGIVHEDPSSLVKQNAACPQKRARKKKEKFVL